MTAATRPQRVLTGARLSELAACPRRCACRIVGHEPEPFTARQERYLNRGRLFQRYVQAQFEARYGKQNVEAERPIAWGDGWTGHADLYIQPEKLLVEVVSTVGGTIDHKIRQAKLYLLHDTEAEVAAVYIVDPSSLDREDLIPVFVTDEDLDTLHGLVEQMQAAAKTGALPACVYATPTGCRFSGCPFTEQAWAGWEPPSPVDMSDTPGLIALANDFYQAKKAREAAKGQVEVTEGEYARLKEALAELLVLPKAPYKAGPFEVSRTPVRGRVTFSYQRACETGALSPGMQDALLPFVKVGDGYDLVNIRRVDDGEPVEGNSWGDEAPF